MNETEYRQLVAGELPCDRLFKDEHALAFHNPKPKAPAHVVVMPLEPYPSLVEFSAQADAEQVAGFFSSLGKATRLLGFDQFRVQCDERGPGIPFRFELIGGVDFDGGNGGVAAAAPAPEASTPTAPEASTPPAPSEPPPATASPPRAPPLEVDPKALALVALPSEEDPSPARVEAAAAALEIEPSDARQLLRTPLPRVIRRAQAEEIQTLAKTLDAAGVTLGCVEVQKLFTHVDSWLVEWLEYENKQIFMRGAEGRVALSLGDRRALLVEGNFIPPPPQDRLVGGGGAGRLGLRRKTVTNSLKRTRFGHLYLEGEHRPYAFVESEIRDWMFLRDDMTASARQNFAQLMQIVRDMPRVETDTAMLEHPGLVGASIGALWSAGRSARGLERPHTVTLSPDVELMSRLVYYTTF